jgi:hypothetical protein
VITLLTTLELATAAHRLGVAPAAARRLELIDRAIEAAPDAWRREGFALDGSTALLGVYLAPIGVARVPAALEIAPYTTNGSADTLRAAIAAALGSHVEGEEIVFDAAEDPLRSRKAAPENLRLAVHASRVPLTFEPPAAAAKHSGAVIGAICADPLRFAIGPTARPPAAVPVAYFEELIFRLLTRLAAGSGGGDLSAQDDFITLALRLPTETRRAIEERVLPAFRSALALRGLDPAEALPALGGRIRASLRAHDAAAAAAPGWRVDAAQLMADRLRVSTATDEILAQFEVTR